MLSGIQASIWHILSVAEGRTVERRVIAETIGGTAADRPDSRSIDMHIARLRRALGEFGGRIETVRGRGYRLRPETLNYSNLVVDK